MRSSRCRAELDEGKMHATAMPFEVKLDDRPGFGTELHVTGGVRSPQLEARPVTGTLSVEVELVRRGSAQTLMGAKGVVPVDEDVDLLGHLRLAERHDHELPEPLFPEGAHEALQHGDALPDLLGIVANVARDNELCAITEELLDARPRAHDRALDSLVAELATASATLAEPAARLSHLVDRAADALRKLDRFSWLRAAADALIAAADSNTARAEWIRFSATRIHAALHLSPRDRADMVRFLARRALPVE